MSRIDDLIGEMCPNGVEFARLKDVARIRNGSDYKSFGPGDVPVYGTGGVMATVDTAVHDQPSVLIPRKGSLNKLYFVDVPFWTVDTIFYTEIFDHMVPKFLFYFLQRQHLEDLNQAGGVPSLTQSVLNQLLIPVPPLEVQREIVSILDGFTRLEAELKAELEARRRQYEHYRDLLLAASDETDWAPLGDVLRLVIDHRGKTPKKLGGDWTSDGHRVVSALNMKNGTVDANDHHYISPSMYSKWMRQPLKRGDVLLTSEAPLGAVAYIDDTVDWAIGQRLFALRPDSRRLDGRFLYHLLLGGPPRAELFSRSTGSTVSGIRQTELVKISVPLPGIKDQQRIVAILDDFDALVNDISIGLPAEIAARRKQYEHYRDKLLTFDEVVSA